MVVERRMQKRNFSFPPDLIERAQRVARSHSANLSQIVRKAVEEFVDKKEREELDQEVIRACKANREFDKEFASEWAQYETRVE
ncbi:MAG: hypothetical protein WBG80_14465 [Bacteroidota bacterium]